MNDALNAAYRERAHLVALLASMTPGAVIAPAPDVDDEPGWQIVYLTVGGRQCAWHIALGDADLFVHVERVTADDPRAQWDGHTTDEKYRHIAGVTAYAYAAGEGPVNSQLRDLVAQTARTIPLRLGPNSVAMVQGGHPIVLNWSEAGKVADAVLRAVAEFQREHLRQQGYDLGCVCEGCSVCLAKEYIALLDPAGESP